jgi:putative endonuclease
MSLHNKNIGRIGEEMARHYLQDHGYILLKQNFTTHWGELDLIMQKENKIIFVEVKTKIGDIRGKPYDAITPAKLFHLKRPIQYFLMDKKYKDFKYALDVISVTLNSQLLKENLQHFQNIEF